MRKFDHSFLEDLKPKPEQTCVQCGHRVERQGFDWLCEKRCRCMMMGCQLNKGEEFNARAIKRGPDGKPQGII